MVQVMAEAESGSRHEPVATTRHAPGRVKPAPTTAAAPSAKRALGTTVCGLQP
jgi:hypothetical protein